MTKGYYQGFHSLEAFAAHYQVFNPRRVVGRKEQLRRINWLYLVEAAKRVRKTSNSYRNFQVGCAIWAFKTLAYNAGGRWAVFTGSNIKLTEDSRPVCAEQFAIGAAKSGGYDKIIAMVVVGEPQPDAESKLQSKTLHPCSECRKIFQATPEMTPETLILTITPDEQSYEQFLMAGLIALHQNAQQRHDP